MSNMLLALDESTVSCGYSIFVDEKIMDYGVFKPNSKNVLERISEIAYQIEDIIETYGIEEIVLENIMITMNAPTAKALMGLETILEIIAFRKQIPCTSLRTTSWRKTLGLSNSPKLKRAEKKKETTNYVNDKYNLDIKIDDISDSIAIGTAYLINKKEKGDI